MSSRREEERNEKIIRGLTKLPPNRRCINCNSLGPQYVCTNFWTFVCMTCSGIHREFTHRVKSVSMSKFTSQEVDSLQKGGNQRARELYLKAWDPQRDRLPDNSNADKVRDFIKNVYVNRKYSMDNSTEKPPRDPQGLRNNEDEKRRASSYHSYSQSPPYEFEYEERRYGKHAPTLTRKPGSDRGIYEGKLSSFLSPSRFGDHANDERFTKRTASSGSFGSFDSNSMSFKSVNSSEPEPPSVISHDKSLPGTFGGLDLFDAPFAPQNANSAPPTGNNSQLPVSSLTQPVKSFQQLSTFTEQQPSQIQQPSLFDLFSPTQQQSGASSTEKKSDDVMPNEGGWATFDMAQRYVPVASDNSAPAVVSAPDQNVAGKFNPFSFDQSSSYSAAHEPATPSYSLWHEGLQTVETTTSTAPIWNAFEDSAEQHPIPNVLQNNEQAIEHYDSNANKSFGFAALEEGLYNDGNVRISVESETPSGLTSYSNTASNDFSMVSHVAGAREIATNHNPSNPFDLPFDSEMESENVSQYWDVSSLQASLPNNTQNEPSSSYIGDANQSWFPQNPIQSYIPAGVTFDHPTGSLGLMAGQIPNPNIVTIPAQGPVTSVGGNPFA